MKKVFSILGSILGVVFAVGVCLKVGIICLSAYDEFSKATNAPPAGQQPPVVVKPLPEAARDVTDADFVGTWYGKATLALGDNGSVTVEGDTTYKADGGSLSLDTVTMVLNGPKGFTLHLIQTETGKWHIEDGQLTETTETRVRRGATADDMKLIEDNPLCARFVADKVDHEPETFVISEWKSDSCTLTSVEVIEGVGRVSMEIRRTSK